VHLERGEGATEQFVPGIGLGLAVVRDLANAIGAQVELRSAPGAGSTFTVFLPLPQRRRGAAAEAGESPARGERGGSGASGIHGPPRA
jgi:K+-sensing histidine kinase KdpD